MNQSSKYSYKLRVPVTIKYLFIFLNQIPLLSSIIKWIYLELSLLEA